ncbi:MAG: tetratricopeptide repeat protein, partial [Phycisphaerales bacterium]|nr:tetratricopeptide repeat protein [Phycisphaerales bacterium]
MLRKFTVCAILLVLGVRAAAEEVDTSGSSALAERLAKLAQINLQRKEVGEDNFRQAEALLQAAHRLNPAEPRFLRLLLESQLQLKHTEAAIESLNRYLALQPNDQVARLQLVDLYLTQLESAEARLKYLYDLVGTRSISPELRAAVAVRCARLHIDRDESQRAWVMLDKALELNPLDPDACDLHWLRVSQSGSAAERVSAVLAMIRANPTDPEHFALLGRELAGAGLHEAAQQWYMRAIDLAPRAGRPLAPETFLESAISAYILGQAKTAEGRVSFLLQQGLDDFDVHAMNLVCWRRIGGEQATTDALNKATDALVRRVNALHRELTGTDSPTTKPSGELHERIPDPVADAAAVLARNDPAITEAYAEALVDLAFVRVYFANRPAEIDT